MKLDWQILRNLRVEILYISEEIQTVALNIRELDSSSKNARKLNDLQVRLGKLIGLLYDAESKDKCERT